MYIQFISFQFVAQTVTYPLSVVTTVTAMNRSGLRAGMLPITPVYGNWQDAYYQMSKGVCYFIIIIKFKSFFFLGTIKTRF
jgi:hypothetical protein